MASATASTPLICFQPTDGRYSQTPLPGNTATTSPIASAASSEALAAVSWNQVLVVWLYSQTPWLPNWPTTTGVVLGVVDLFSRNATALVFRSPTARSVRPSPLKSATASAPGPSPAAKLCGAAKEKAAAPTGVVFVRIDTLSPAKFETTTSGRPSPSKSPTASL